MVAPNRPAASSPAIRARMERQRRRDTGPELAVRKALHAKGLRYRVDIPPIPGTRRRADIVFTRVRVAVFVDGCFWHGCPQHATLPKSNTAWWTAKLDANRHRDRDTDEQLLRAGWTVLRVWEHEDMTDIACRVFETVRSR
jgi:DNA mismatch endonuclease (patch repair protein)